MPCLQKVFIMTVIIPQLFMNYMDKVIIPISAEDLIKQNKDYDLFNFHRSKRL
jgi:hypothetical protein